MQRVPGRDVAGAEQTSVSDAAGQQRQIWITAGAVMSGSWLLRPTLTGLIQIPWPS